MDDFKALLSVAYNIKQAQTETDKVVKEIKKNAKIQFDLDISDKEAKKAINETRKDYQNWWRTALSQESNLQKQKDNFNKKNLSAIDLEIKKRKEQAAQFSSQIKSQILESQKLAKAQQSALTLNQDKDILKNRINSYVKNNPALREMSSDFIRLRDSVDSLDKVGLSSANKEFRQLQASVMSLGKTGDTYFSKLGKNVQQFLGFLGSATLVMSGVNALREMVVAVKDLDTAMTELRKVTDESEATYRKFFNTAAASAQKLGSSISDVINMTADWARAGYNLTDSAKLAEVSTVFQNVADMNVGDSVSNIITPMKAFNIAASDAITVVDKLNKVDNEFSVTASDISSGLANSASALALAGNDLNESIALLTGGSEIECVSPSAVMHLLCA